MKDFVFLIILSLLSFCYASSLCDTSENSTNSMGESIHQNEICVPLYGNNKKPKPRGPSGKRNKPNNQIDPTQSQKKGIKELVDMGAIGRFSVKHMFMDGRFGGGINSFNELAGNPERLRNYLVDVNRRMFKGNVLPVTISGKETFQKWITQATKNPKKISLVDADLKEIQDDIGAQHEFKDYLELSKTNPKDAMKNSLFTTTRKYLITEIILTMDGDKLVVKLERYMAKLKIGMKSNEIYHWDPFDRSVIQENVNGRTISHVDVESTSSVDEPHETTQTTFTHEQLVENEKFTLDFWKDLFEVPNVEMVGYKGPINDQAKRFSRFELKYRREWREKVVYSRIEIPRQEIVVHETPGACPTGHSSRGCAFLIDPEGNVESIQPEEFLEVFKNKGEDDRKRMLEKVKDNGDKFTGNDENAAQEARRQLNQLVHHDELTEHIDLVDMTGTIQDLGRWKNKETNVPNTASEFVTVIHERISGRLNKVRLSGAKIADSLAKNPSIESINKVGKSYGHLMVAKGIINGIIHNDTTSLAVIGSRFGYDIVTEGAIKVGQKFFTTASKIGKAARVLSKVAGPIGAAVDVGLGAWALSKSVDRLKKADNKYDRDDAIADIVAESIDMVVTIAVTVLSAAFPPAAPIIAAVGLVISIVNNMVNSIFHAQNEVARINAQIPLLGFEKAQVFSSHIFDFFGIREKDYIDYLVEEKKANDLAVASYLDFLKNYTQFSGVVFPSRTLAYEGSCHLRVTYECLTPFGRNTCLKDEVLGRGCDWNKPCGNGFTCMNEKKWWPAIEYFDCICDGKERTEFGFPHKNSVVDFRARQNIFWERAVPGDVPGAEFKCKPGTSRFVDYKTSQDKQRYDYHCSNAIGLNRPKKERKVDQSFLVDLQDGNDKVYVDRNADETYYTFWLGEEGNKNFVGGKSKNDFILSGNCSRGLLNGILNGGPKELDSLIIGSTCAKGHTIEFKKDGTFYYVKLKNKLDLRLDEIENIIGRQNEAESVEVGCNTRGVFLNGGVNSKSPDSISIDASLNCRMDFQTILGNYTNIMSQAMRGDVTIYVGEDITGSTIHVKHPPSTRHNTVKEALPQTYVIFTQTKSQDVMLDDIKVTGNDVSLKLKDHSRQEPLTIKYSSDKDRPVKQHQILFNESSVETPNTFSVLMVPGDEEAAKDSSLMFYHSLQSHNSRKKNIKRIGSDTIPNTFNVTARNWDVRGGAEDDIFLLNVPFNQVRLDGGEGDNTLLINFGQNEMVNFNQAESLNNIQTVVKGSNAGPIEISTSCKTKAIAVNGEGTPDIVKVSSCSAKRELQIDAGGSTRVLVEGDIVGDNETVQILAHQVGKQRVTFELDTLGNKVSRLLVQIPLESHHPELYVYEVVRSSKEANSFHVNLRGAGLDMVIFKLTNNDRDNGPYISSPQIQLIPPKQSVRPSDKKPVQLVFKRETLDPVVIHHVREGNMREIVNGFEKLENVFQLYEPSTHRTVHGGKFKDTFIGTSKAFGFVQLHAFPESDNTLIVTEDQHNSLESQTTFKVDLPQNLMGLLSTSSTRHTSIDGHYHHIVGRVNQPDTIVATCTTKSIAGRGGSAEDKFDLIEFKANQDCKLGNSPTVDMYLGPFTKVDNQAEVGQFKYFVDLTQNAGYLSFAIHSTGNTSNNIVFSLPSLEKTGTVAVDSIKFDKEKKSLTFTVKDRTTRPGVYEFSMYRQDEGNEYSDPQFLFTTSGDNWVTSDVRVDKDESVISTNLMNGDCSSNHPNTIVKGMPVDINSFLVNMTGYGSCGKLEGHTASKENHIWLYRLPINAQFSIVGSDKFYHQENGGSSNTLHIDENFYSTKPLTAYFGKVGSYLDVDGILKLDLQWIDNFAGRNSLKSYDTIIPYCSTNQVSGADLVKILIDPRDDCTFQLMIEVQPATRVEFKWVEDENDERRKNVVNFWRSTFYYRFSEPMSFEVVQSYPGMLDGTVHNFYLPVELNDMETLEFDLDENKLYYTFDSEEYSITMVTEPDDEDQFYPQPNMVTSDGFRIQICRDGSVLVTKFLNGTQPQPLELLSSFRQIANTLVITMVIQTESAFLHIGNDGTVSDRNVLQNLASNVSYMGGGGADDIYEVVSLNKDVYIATGLENVSLAPAVNAEGPYIARQTIDLTDIVAPIRFKLGRKYKPNVFQDEDDLVIIMEGYQTEYPGKVVVYNGATENVRKNLQILLSNAMMEFVSLGDHLWELAPADVHLERESIYSIAAEDLEYNHLITVLDHVYGREYRFRFRCSRNHEDLQLSDIEEFRGHKYDKQHIEMTTVIITDFYKDTSHINPDKGSYDAPTEIRNVTIFMPGLMIRLHGTDVQHIFTNESDRDYVNRMPDHSVSTLTTTPPPPKEFSSISIDMMPKWSSVIHDLEDDVLEGLPFVNRTY